MKELSEYLTESISTGKLSSDAKWVVKSTMKSLKAHGFNDWKKVSVEATEDPKKWQVYYDNKYVEDMNVFPPEQIGPEMTFDILKELGWQRN